MQQILKIQSKYNSYDLEFVDAIDNIVQLTKSENTITIIDRNVFRLYPQLADASFFQVHCVEDVKNIRGTELILDELIKRKANIATKLIVIGGGILQDLVGYCASIYCRGIEYTLVPTTLLAQADSCIGGKTSLNYKNKKNILGTFYPPQKVLICTDFLKTLKDIDYLSGWGEIYKFHILQNLTFKFGDVNEAVYRGLQFKSSILELDEFDKNERKYLNFGHTFAHALESTSNYEIPHGIAVIIGSMIALRISKKLGYNIEKYDSYLFDGKDILHTLKLKFNPEWFDFENLLAIIKSDKKNTGVINMVLINDGPIVHAITDLNLLKESLQETYESIRLHN